MKSDLQTVLDRLQQEKLERGRLSRIASDTGISYRTIYGMMHAKQRPTATTVGRLAAYFTKLERREKVL